MRVLIFVLVILTSGNLSAQKYFEGEIEYVAKVTFQDSVASAETLKHFNYTLLFKDNRYKKVYQDGRQESYDPDKGVLYFHPVIVREYDTIRGITTRAGYDEFEERKIDETENILNIPCEGISFHSKEESDPLLKLFNTSFTYFFNRKYYKVDAKRFADHKADFLNAYFNETGVLPLKTVIEKYGMKIEY